jgi:hypothetical protein
MWALASFFALMEVAAIGVTVSGGWEASQPATNPIIANLCFAIPFLAMTTWAYFDLQRHRRRRRVNATTGRAIQSPDEPSP